MFRPIWVFTKHTAKAYNRHNCAQLAAAISYYVLFSLLPAAILVVSILGLVLGSEEQRDKIVDQVVDTVPLTETEGRSAVDDALNSVQRASGPIAAFGLIATLWTASNMFGSIRRSLNAVFEVEEHRPFFRAKLVDFALLGLLTLVLLASIVLTGLLRTVREVDFAGPLSSENPLWELPPFIIPAIVSFASFALLYHLVPATHPRWRDVLPGALLATLAFQALANVFAFYVANFNNFDVVYGSLAGVLLFLLFTFLASSILLIGAELTRTFERYHAGELDALLHPTEPGIPVTEEVMRALKGLFVRQ
jgi:membrane protein